MVYDLSPAEAARQLGVSQITVKRWAKNGTLKALQTPGGWWRFSQTDLAEFIARRTQRAAPQEATA